MSKNQPRRRKYPRRITTTGVAIGLATFIVLVSAFSLMATVVNRAVSPTEKANPYIGQTGTTATTISPNAKESNTDENNDSSTDSSIVGTVIRPSVITASSDLQATQTMNFRAPNLVDNDLNTCWSEGSDGEGIDEWVKFEFSDPTKIVRIDVSNGDQRNDIEFAAAIRVKTILLEFSNGVTQLVDLLDIKETQSIVTQPIATDWVKITITAVHPGYTRADASISEMRIYGIATN